MDSVVSRAFLRWRYCEGGLFISSVITHYRTDVVRIKILFVLRFSTGNYFIKYIQKIHPNSENKNLYEHIWFHTSMFFLFVLLGHVSSGPLTVRFF